MIKPLLEMKKNFRPLINRSNVSVRLLLGDCLEKLLEVEDGSIDAVICDPPYQVTDCEWDSMIPLELMWAQLFRVVKKHGAVVLTSVQPFVTALISSNPKRFRYEWIWDTGRASGFQLSKIRPMRLHENILVFSEGGVRWFPQKVARKKIVYSTKRTTSKVNPLCHDDGRPRRYSDFGPTTIIRIGKVGGVGRLHPNQKPVELMVYLVKTYTEEGDTVLDFAMGSGSTGVAAVNLGRNFVGIEKDPAIFELAKARLKLKDQ